EEVAGGVVDELIDGPELRLDRIERGAYGLGIAHVGSCRRRLSARVADRAHRLVQRFGAPADHRHPRAERGEAQGHGATEAAASAGDECGLARQQVLAERVEGFHVTRFYHGW